MSDRNTTLNAKFKYNLFNLYIISNPCKPDQIVLFLYKWLNISELV